MHSRDRSTDRHQTHNPMHILLNIVRLLATLGVRSRKPKMFAQFLR